MSCFFVASKRNVGVNSKRLNSEVKIKVEPVDDNVVMGELACMWHGSCRTTFNIRKFQQMRLHLKVLCRTERRL